MNENNLGNNKANFDEIYTKIYISHSYKSIDVESFINIISVYFIKCQNLNKVEQSEKEIIYNNFKKINEITSEKLFYKNLMHFNENITDFFINNVLSNITISNNAYNSKVKIFPLYIEIYKIIKTIINDCIVNNYNDFLINEKFIAQSEKIFIFYFETYINEIILFINNINKNNNSNNNDVISLLLLITEIFLSLFEFNNNWNLLSTEQKYYLFQQNLEFLLFLKQINYLSEIKEIIYENILKITYIYYKNYSLDSSQLEEIHINKSNQECILIFKDFILKENNKIKNLNLFIEFFSLIILYENINENEQSIENKIFNESYIEQLKYYFINKEEIWKQLEILSNFLSDISNKEYYSKLIRIKSSNNSNTGKIKKVLLDLINKPNDSIYKKILDEIKIIFSIDYNYIINMTENNNEFYIEEKNNNINDILKLLNFFILSENNLYLLINDPLFSCIIAILDNESLFNNNCKEQAFILFNNFAQNEAFISSNAEIFLTQNFFMSYLLKEFLNFINTLNLLIQEKENMETNNLLTLINNQKVITISKIIRSLSNNRIFWDIYNQYINFNNICTIFIVNDSDINKNKIIDSDLLKIYLNILKNYYIFNEDNDKAKDDILFSLIIKNISEYSSDKEIIISLILLIESKQNDIYFIKFLQDNKIFEKIFQLYDKNNNEINEYILQLTNTLFQKNNLDFFINDFINNYLVNICDNIINNNISEKIGGRFQSISNLIIKNENININKNLYEMIKNTIISILNKFVDSDYVKLIKQSLDIILYMIESLPKKIQLNFDKLTNENNNLLLNDLFKAINNSLLNDININSDKEAIIINSTKIIFRIISLIKINKETKDNESFENEYIPLLKIVENENYLNFIYNNLYKIIWNFYNKNEHYNLCKTWVEIIRILINIINSEINHIKMFNCVVTIIKKCIKFFIDENKIYTENNQVEILDDFIFLFWKLIMLQKAIVSHDITDAISILNLIIDKIPLNQILIERNLQVIYQICIYSSKIQIYKKINDIKNMLYKTMPKVTSIDKIFLITKIFVKLSKYSFDILNNNICFFLKNSPKVSDKNYNQEDLNEFKEGITKLCNLYYITSKKESLNILNIINSLYNEYTSLSNSTTQIIFEIKLLLSLIRNLCDKTPYLKNEIKKSNSSILSQIKIYTKNLSKEDLELTNELYLCQKIINDSDKKYIPMEKEILRFSNKRRKMLLIEKIGELKYSDIFIFSNNKLEINLYFKGKNCKKYFMYMDEDMRILYISNEIKGEIIDWMKIDYNVKIVNDNSDSAFDIKGFFVHKAPKENCFSLYYKYNNTQNNFNICIDDSKCFNIECENETIKEKYINLFNCLIEFSKDVNE